MTHSSWSNVVDGLIVREDSLLLVGQRSAPPLNNLITMSSAAFTHSLTIFSFYCSRYRSIHKIDHVSVSGGDVKVFMLCFQTFWHLEKGWARWVFVKHKTTIQKMTTQWHQLCWEHFISLVRSMNQRFQTNLSDPWRSHSNRLSCDPSDKKKMVKFFMVALML